MGVSVCTAAARSGYGNISFLNRFCDRPESQVSSVSAGFGRFEGVQNEKKRVDRPVCLIRDKARQNGGKLREKTTAMEKKLERTIKKERAAGLLQRRPFLQSNPFPGGKRPGAAEGTGCPSRLRRNARPSPPHPRLARPSEGGFPCERGETVRPPPASHPVIPTGAPRISSGARSGGISTQNYGFLMVWGFPWIGSSRDSLYLTELSPVLRCRWPKRARNLCQFSPPPRTRR